MKKLLLSLILCIVSIGISFGQCPVGVNYQGGTAPAVGNSTTMTTCAYAGEYQTVTGVVAGDQYVLTYTGGVSNYVTIYDNTFTAVAFGVSPLNWTATGSGTYHSQPNYQTEPHENQTSHQTALASHPYPADDPAPLLVNYPHA